MGRAARHGDLTRASASWALCLLSLGSWGCLEAQSPRDETAVESLSGQTAALVAEDGLAQAYAAFRDEFVRTGQDQLTRMSFGYDPLLATERVSWEGKPIEGDVTFDFVENRVTATLRNAPPNERFELWVVRNVEGPGKDVRFESGDQFFVIGTFAPGRGVQTLDELVAGHVDFDFDFVAIVRAGGHARLGNVATGARTLFEKRFFRERLGLDWGPVVGTLANDVESLDPLVRRGAELFARETFAGNGRTCETCHRAENNLTIDPAFIAMLPASDPLFVSERVPALSALEDLALLRKFGLIRENLDGFEAPAEKFVMRATQHTLAMSTSIGTGDLPIFAPDGTPPDQRIGFSGDGAHGRGTLSEFGLGAVFQHLTRSLARVPGVDFRVPTQGELDALEAFQLFSGRQKNPQTQAIVFRDADVEAGKQLFVTDGQCVSCHRDLVAGRENFLVDTGVEAMSRSMGLPVDGGIGKQGTKETGFGSGRFNVPPLVEAADTAPYFHNAAVGTLEEAIAFYTGPFFAASPGRAFSGVPNLDDRKIAQLGAFLRVVNALENMRQVRKRVAFVAANRSPGNTRILDIALADMHDAITVLSEKQLSKAALHALRTAELTLIIGRAHPDELRPAYMSNARTWLEEAKRALVMHNPTHEF